MSASVGESQSGRGSQEPEQALSFHNPGSDTKEIDIRFLTCLFLTFRSGSTSLRRNAACALATPGFETRAGRLRSAAAAFRRPTPDSTSHPGACGIRGDLAH